MILLELPNIGSLVLTLSTMGVVVKDSAIAYKGSFFFYDYCYLGFLGLLV